MHKSARRVRTRMDHASAVSHVHQAQVCTPSVGAKDHNGDSSSSFFTVREQKFIRVFLKTIGTMPFEELCSILKCRDVVQLFSNKLVLVFDDLRASGEAFLGASLSHPSICFVALRSPRDRFTRVSRKWVSSKELSKEMSTAAPLRILNIPYVSGVPPCTVSPKLQNRCLQLSKNLNFSSLVSSALVRHCPTFLQATRLKNNVFMSLSV